MKLLTKHTDYAVQALLVMAAKPDEFISSRQIAEQQNIPHQFLRRILQELLRNKIIISKEGGKGGVRLNKKPQAIKLTDIIKIFQGTIQLSECMFQKKLCHNRSKCVLRKQICRIEKIVQKEFAGITIGSLLEDLNSVSSEK